MPLQATSGAASYDAFGGGAAAVPQYIEEVFQTWLYTGNDTSGTTTQTITNNIDLSTKGGLVWVKWRSGAVGSGNHVLVDTSRGVNKFISSNTTAAEATQDTVSAFNTTGFTLLGSGGGKTNYSGDLYASWTFRKQPKFFDIVTYTGNDAASRNIAHNLGSTPGCIIIKNTSFSGAQAWVVWHRTQNDKYLQLWKTDAAATDGGSFYPSLPTSTDFTIGPAGAVNGSSSNYVAYLFAHDAGGFGLTGTDNVISCGSFTTDGSGNGSATLGYEPQWVLFKRTDSTQNWVLMDNMRNFVASPNDSSALYPNLSNAEGVFGQIAPNATGFSGSNFSSSASYIYIAIRRGPMKTPTVGTSVFTPDLGSNADAPWFTSGFPVDWALQKNPNAVTDWFAGTRLLSGTSLRPNSTIAEFARASHTFDFMNGWNNTTGASGNAWSAMFRRAPSFFDVVCYTGDGTFDGSYNVNHNLGVAPEFIIAKRRNSTNNWNCYHSGLTSATYQIRLNLTAGQQNTGQSWGPTSTTFKPQYAGNADNSSNVNTGTYVAYLFSTCAGVSKVGSYTGTGTTLQVDCGFTAGARFVLIKRIDDSGDWYVWDSARGIVAGNDPYLLLNSTAAEDTSTDYIDTYNAGFEISSTAPDAINASGGTFIFFAVA